MTFRRFERVQGALARAAVVVAALDLDMLDALAESPLSPHALAGRCGVEADAAALMLDVLAELGVVTSRSDGRYSVVMSPALLRKTHQIWGGVAARARGGPPVVALDEGEAGAFYADLAEVLSEPSRAPARWMAERLGRDGQRVVDVGAGASPWGLALAARHDLEVTAVDLPEVVDVAHRAAENRGLADRVSVLALDIRVEHLPRRSFDLAVVAHLLHLFSDADARRVLANVHGSLKPGGRVAVVTLVHDGDGEAAPATYRLGLMLRTCHGRVYPFSAYASWLREAGFHGIERHDVPGPWPSVLIIATS